MNRWREVDGFMCRDSNDCNWIDRQLYCQDYELEFTPNVSGGQFVHDREYGRRKDLRENSLRN